MVVIKCPNSEFMRVDGKRVEQRDFVKPRDSQSMRGFTSGNFKEDKIVIAV